MKKLIYKEFMLSLHPLCYIFVFVFPLMCLIPNFPIFIGTLYIIPAFSILCLGANKGKQTNDLFYSALLPIRKQDIVKARMISVMFMELATLSMLAILYPLKRCIEKAMPAGEQALTSAGIVSSFAFAIIAYTIVNIIFFLMFYKKGRSIVAPTLISTVVYVVIILLTTILSAVDPKTGNALVPGYYVAFIDIHIGYQFLYVVIALIIYFISNFLVFKKASQELMQADL